MPAPKYEPHYTFDDYQAWDGHWELWNGVAVAMTPSPFGRHQWVAGQILSQINQQLKENGCGDCFALGETDWIVSSDMVVRPDVTVVCGEFPEEYIESPPRLIVEILSASTAEKDRSAKYQLYEQERVGHYLIVDPNAGTGEFYCFDDQLRQYRHQTAAETIEVSLHSDCAIQLSLAGIKTGQRK